jgi:hypothetical protein
MLIEGDKVRRIDINLLFLIENRTKWLPITISSLVLDSSTYMRNNACLIMCSTIKMIKINQVE